MAPTCAFSGSRARLRDAHRLWHQALDSYHDPDAFRTFLNATIAALRNVTFLLQKEQAAIPDFDRWYEEWRDRMGQDEILTWLVAARNQVVKQGDLDTTSFVRVSIVATHDDAPPLERELDPNLHLGEIANVVMESPHPDWVRDEGTVTVERCWRVSALGEREILDALGNALGSLIGLIVDAHVQRGLSEDDAEACVGADFRGDHALSRAVGWRPSCTIAAKSTRSLTLRLSTGEEVMAVSRRHEFDEQQLEGAAEHYGGLPLPEREATDLRSISEYFFSIGKTMILKDGHHLPVAILLSDQGNPTILQLRYDDQAEKYLALRELSRAIEVYRAESVIFIAEAWTAPFDRDHPNRPAREAPDRWEVLGLTAASRSGVEFSWSCEITRSDQGLSLGDEAEEEPRAIMFLEPVRVVWHKWDADEAAG